MIEGIKLFVFILLGVSYAFGCIYEVCPEGIQPCTVKNRHLLKKIQDTRNIVHRTMTPESPLIQAPWDLTQFY